MTADIGIITVIGPELIAVQKQLKVDNFKDREHDQGSLFWRKKFHTEVTNESIEIVIHCQGDANNSNAAVACTKIIERFKPKMMFLVGIAAGRETKCKIGDVVIPRAVIDYTNTVAEKGERQPRYIAPPLPYAVIQMLRGFNFDKGKWHNYFNEIFLLKPEILGALEQRFEKTRVENSIAKIPELRESVICSADVLLRDEEVLEKLAATVNQQVRVGEMEAAGFIKACSNNYPSIPWLVIRGVSDFGNELKDDSFHEMASCAAAAYLGYFLKEGLDLRLLNQEPGNKSPAKGGVQTALTDYPSICRDFPIPKEYEIPRNNFLDAVSDFFQNDVKLVIVEGEEGIGRTTLLAQYARRKPTASISLFLKPVSKISYSPDYVRTVLGEQIYWLLNQEPPNQIITESLYKSLLFELQKHAQKNRIIYYFVVDGLFDIPPEAQKERDSIISDHLPIGFTGFHFLVSGNINEFPESIKKTTSHKTLTLVALTHLETDLFFPEESFKDSIKEIHRMCRGNPRNLAAVRRLLKNGVSINDLQNVEQSSFPDFVRVEWKKMGEISPKAKQVLALVSYAQSRMDKDQVCRLLKIEENDFYELVKTIPVLSYSDETRELEFVSEAHRNYSKKCFTDLKSEVTNVLIEDLENNSTSENALELLPEYYRQTNRIGDLLKYLDDDYFSKLLEKSHSLTPIAKKAELGIEVAKKANNREVAFSFAFQGTIISDLNQAVSWRSEVGAKIALEEFDSAFELAHNVLLREDKFHLLSEIAKTKRKKGLPLQTELVDQIKVLSDQVNPAVFGARVIEIAQNIMWFDPDLAFRIVEKATEKSQNQVSQDFAFAALSFTALDICAKEDKPRELIDKTRAKIKDQEILDFSNEAEIVFEKYSPQEVIRQAEKISPERKLKFLHFWFLRNNKNSDCGDVIDYALDIIIKNTLYTPKIQDFRILALPLPYLTDKEKIRALIGRFDSQLGTIQNFGSSEDWIKVQILLAIAEASISPELPIKRTLGVYWYISDISDLTIKADCLGLLVSNFKVIDVEGIIEKKEGILQIAQAELQSNIESLLSSVADQYYAARGAISALSKNLPEMAIRIAQRLNTQRRRDLAMGTLLVSGITDKYDEFPLPIFKEAFSAICDLNIKYDILSRVLRAIRKAPKKFTAEQLSKCNDIFNLVVGIPDRFCRCYEICFVLSIFGTCKLSKNKFSIYLENELEKAWSEIDNSWKKADLGFEVTSLLAEYDKTVAKTFLKRAEEIRNSIKIEGENATHLVFSSCRIAIRSLKGLLVQRLDSEEYLKKLSETIGSLSCLAQKTFLWSEVALSYFLEKRSDDGKKIVSERIYPALDSVLQRTPDNFGEIFFLSVIPVYLTANFKALDYIDTKVSPVERDSFRFVLIEYIFKKVSPWEPWDNTPGEGYDVSYEDLLESITLLREIKNDSLIAQVVEGIADSIQATKNRKKFTIQQKNDLGNRLEELVAKRLPDKNNITHDGFLITCRAHIARFYWKSQNEWDNLLAVARNIPNLADKGYVLCQIAAILPERKAREKKEIVQEALQCIKQLPSEWDKVDRFQTFANMVGTTDLALTKEILKESLKLSLSSFKPEQYTENRRQMLNLAYKINPEFATELINIIDNDPARLEAKNELNRQMALLKLKNKIAESDEGSFEKEFSFQAFAQASWQNLGILNSSKGKPLPFEKMIPYIISIGDKSLTEAFPVFAWIIENLNQRLKGTPQAKSTLIAIFESCLKNSRLLVGLIEKSSIKNRNYRCSPKVYINDKNSENGNKSAQWKIIEKWFETERPKEILICDRYYDYQDLEIIRNLTDLREDIEFKILIERPQDQNRSLEEIRDYWRFYISENEPPPIEIIFLTIEGSKDFPSNDRWLLGHNTGVRLGNPFEKNSDVSEIDSSTAQNIHQMVDGYFARKIKKLNGARVTYITLSV